MKLLRRLSAAVQDRSIRDLSIFEVAPESDEDPPGHGDDATAPGSFAGVGISPLEPAGDRTIPLVVHPAPRDLVGHPSHALVAGLLNSRGVVGFAALPWGRGEARQAPDLAPILELSPGEELHDEQPGALDPNAAELHQITDLLKGRIVGLGTQALLPFGLQGVDLLAYALKTNPFSFESGAEFGGKGRAVPEAGVAEMGWELGVQGEPQALGGQEAVDTVGASGALVGERLDLPMEPTAILGLPAGDMNHAPDIPFASHVPAELSQEASHVQPVALAASAAAVHLDARGVDHVVFHALGQEIAMEPEGIATGVVAADDSGAGGKSKPFEGLVEFRLQGVEVPGRDDPLPR